MAPSAIAPPAAQAGPASDPDRPGPRPARFGIRARLGLGLGLLFALFLSAAIVFQVQTRATSRIVDGIVEVAEPMGAAALEMEINLIGTGFAVLGYLHDRDSLHLRRIADDTEDFLMFQRRYHELARTPEAKALGRKVDAGYARFREIADALVAAENEQTWKLSDFETLIQLMDDLLDDKIQPAIARGGPGAFEKMEAALEIELNINEIAKDVHAFMRTHDAGWRDRIEKDARDLQRYLDAYRGLDLSSEEAEWAAEISRLSAASLALARDIVALDAAKEKRLAEFVQRRRLMDDLLDDEIQALALKAITDARNDLAQTLGFSNFAVFGLLTLGLALAVATAWSTFRGIAAPVRRLTAAAQAMARGDATHPELPRSGDEFGILSREFNAMVEARRRAEAEVRSAQLGLEKQVRERTVELESVNEVLRTEMAERERFRRQFLHAQKMEAIGQLTGGIAHDFNNLLGVVTGNVELAQKRLAQGRAGVEALLNSALDAALRGADLNRRLMAFARRESLAPQTVDLSAEVRDMAQLLRKSVGERVEIRFDLEDKAWPVTVELSHLDATIINLAVNARDAMPAGGLLTIETRNIPLGVEIVTDSGTAPPGEYVMLAVRDTGVGISEEDLPRIFEPFFTTKENERGTGLGLAMVWGFVRQSHGYVAVESRPGRGTEFRIYLPRARENSERLALPAAPEKAAEGLAAPAGRGETILMVEDNADLRRATSQQLTEIGYRVFEAANADDALAVLRSRSGIDLLFTDIVMPGAMDGLDLVHAVRAEWPGIAVLLTTGFARRAPHAGAEEGPMPGTLLKKPYRMYDLAVAVRRILDQRAADA